MTAIETGANREIKTAAERKSAAPFEKFFYPAVGLLFLALTIIGFHHFYLQGRAYPGRPLTPEIKALIIIHGVAMAGWILLFSLQPLLILTKNHKLHMTLGKIGAVLAAAIFFLGLYFAVQSAAAMIKMVPPEFRIWSLKPSAFLVVPFASVCVFAAGVGIAIWKRKRPAIHKSMMFLATLSATGAAISRIDFLNNLFVGTILERIWGPFFMPLCIGVALLLIKLALARKFDKWIAGGLGTLIVLYAAAMQFARSDAWDSFTSMLVR